MPITHADGVMLDLESLSSRISLLATIAEQEASVGRIMPTAYARICETIILPMADLVAQAKDKMRLFIDATVVLPESTSAPRQRSSYPTPQVRR